MSGDQDTAVAWLSLGSNLGDRLAHLRRAVVALSSVPGAELFACSGVYLAAPVSKGFSHDFYNAVVGLRTTLEPLRLLGICQEIENEQRRDRSRPDRTIDIDLLLYTDTVLETPELTLPHPRMTERRFVLEPLAEVAPEVVHPANGLTVGALLDRLGRDQKVQLLPLPLF